MYSNEEMYVLNKMAKELFGCYYNQLDDEDKDMLYCIAADNGMI